MTDRQANLLEVDDIILAEDPCHSPCGTPVKARVIGKGIKSARRVIDVEFLTNTCKIDFHWLWPEQITRKI